MVICLLPLAIVVVQSQGKTFLCLLSHLGPGIVLANNFIPVFPQFSEDLTENLNELLWPSQHFVMALGVD